MQLGYLKTNQRAYDIDNGGILPMPMQAMGDVDELNSCIGVAREFSSELDANVAQQVGLLQRRISIWTCCLQHV
jgi:hypothetical protein